MATSSLYGTFKLSPDAAIKWFEKKGLTPSWDWFELWEQAHAKSFTVAKSMSYDILGDIQQATEQALKQGLTKRQYRQLLEKKLKAKGWWGKQTVINPKTGKPQVVQLGSPWRLNTIYRTNMQSAMMAGRWKRFYENKRNRPYLQYIAVMDAATRHSHAELHGKIFHVDDPIWQSIWPPNGFNCRCRVRALTEKQARQRGYKPGEKYTPSDGFPDKGFSHNNGTGQLTLYKKLWSSISKLEKSHGLGKINIIKRKYLTDPIIVEQYQRTVNYIFSRGKEAGSHRENIVLLAGFLSTEAVSMLDVSHGVISLHERLLVGSKADRKSSPRQGTRRRGAKARATQPLERDWVSLPELMLRPKAVFYQSSLKSILYVLETEDRFMKIVVKKSKGNPDVRSAGYIEELTQFGGKDFVLLQGRID